MPGDRNPVRLFVRTSHIFQPGAFAAPAIRKLTMKIAYCYLRVSTEEQADSKNGLEAQEASCRALAEKLGIRDVRTFVDPAVHGYTGIDERSALGPLLMQICKGDCLIVAKRDRIARDPGIVAIVEMRLRKAKATLYSCAGEGSTGVVDPYDVSALLQRRLTDVFAEVELLQIRNRTRAALLAKNLRGERVGATAYGYQLKADGLHTKTHEGIPRCTIRNPECKGCLNLEPSIEERRIVIVVHNLRLKMSIQRVTKYLNDHEFKTRTGKPWQNTQIVNIMAMDIVDLNAAA